jgi:hypothetical protein
MFGIVIDVVEVALPTRPPAMCRPVGGTEDKREQYRRVKLIALPHLLAVPSIIHSGGAAGHTQQH